MGLSGNPPHIFMYSFAVLTSFTFSFIESSFEGVPQVFLSVFSCFVWTRLFNISSCTTMVKYHLVLSGGEEHPGRPYNGGNDISCLTSVLLAKGEICGNPCWQCLTLGRGKTPPPMGNNDLALFFQVYFTLIYTKVQKGETERFSTS